MLNSLQTVDALPIVGSLDCNASNIPVNPVKRAGLETLSPDLITRELGRLGRVAHELQRQHVVSVARLNDQVEWLLEGNAELVA